MGYLRSLVSLFLVACFVGCGGTTAGPLASYAVFVPTPTPMATATTYACSDVAVVGPRFVSPSPGATGVSTSPAQITFVDEPPTSSVTVSFVPTSGATISVGTLTQPSPQPSAPASVSLPYPQLVGATTYAVSFKDTSSNCQLAIESSGSFTTR